MELKPTFEKNKLSERELQVLELATMGATDIQIAQKLDIRPSTVNSYWVRIRNKLGQMNRTEMVSMVLRDYLEDKLSVLTRRNEELEQNARERLNLGGDADGCELFQASLESMPEPIFVLGESGEILLANEGLAALFGYTREELNRITVETLVPGLMAQLGTAFATASPRKTPFRMGIDSVIYGKRKNGSLIRIILLANGRKTSRGLLISFIVRSFAATP